MSSSDFIKRLERASRITERMPQRLAVVAVNFSKERFIQKNWVDTHRIPWKQRKRKGRGSLMAQTGRLKRSIRKVYVSQNIIVIGSDVPYAQIHNDGGTINQTVNVRSHKRKITVNRQRTNLRTRKTTKLKSRVAIGDTFVKAHKRKMSLTLPPRQFIGESALLIRRLERQIIRDLDNALN